jgi:hypothetical protein
LKEAEPSEVPFQVDDVRQAVRFAFHAHEGEYFPIPHVTKGFASDKIKDMVLKSTWSFDMIGSPHISVEVSQHRHWKGIQTNAKPEASSGIRMHSTIWEYELGSPLTKAEPRQWPDDASHLFHTELTGMAGYMDFIKQISLVHDVLQAARKAETRS